MISSAVASSIQLGGGSIFGDSGLATILFGTISGGITAELTGEDGALRKCPVDIFSERASMRRESQGAATGLAVSALNHVAHRIGNEQMFSGDENGNPIKPRPDASKIDEKYGVGNKTWEKKKGRWTITTKKEILQWDSKKGEIEVYNRGQKEHLGGYDPYNRGKQISPAKSSRVPNGGWKVTTSKTRFSAEKIIKPAGKLFRFFDLMAIPAMTMELLQLGDPNNYQQQLYL